MKKTHKALKVIAIILGSLLVLAIGLYFLLTSNTQIFVGMIQKGMYGDSSPNSVDLLQRNIRTTDNSTNIITAALAAVFVLSEASTLPFRTKGMSHTLIHYLCSTH